VSQTIFYIYNKFLKDTLRQWSPTLLLPLTGQPLTILPLPGSALATVFICEESTNHMPRKRVVSASVYIFNYASRRL